MMKKSLCRVSAASGPGSCCSSFLSREQNFCRSSSWSSLNKDDTVSSLAPRDLVEGLRHTTLSWDGRTGGRRANPH